MNILVVEDNREIAQNICDYLALQQHIVDVTHNGLHAIELLQSNTYDAIILDIMLPGMDGLTICETLRNKLHISTPVIMLTARDSLNDKLLGFDAGTDDYLVKPFALAELAVRLQALQRRSQPQKNRTLNVADLTYNLDTLEVTREHKAIKLNPSCLKLLKLLMQYSPNVVEKQKLEQALWQDDLPDSNILKIHMHTLRSLIDKPFKHSIIETVHGVGYRMRDHQDV
ncbi:MAG: response regulator transcription factor [Gammaproteobacteria bacterium]|nr:response regulator transcription factor [Gammaproteobacteria bacterium]